MVYAVMAAGAKADIHGIGAAKQVMEVAHYFLVGPCQKQTD